MKQARTEWRFSWYHDEGGVRTQVGGRLEDDEAMYQRGVAVEFEGNGRLELP